jgi:hypothetical protein
VINGRADALVTFNVKSLAPAAARLAREDGARSRNEFSANRSNAST